MASLRFKYFYKDLLNWRESEFLRVSRSHPLVLAGLFDNKKITRPEQEEWFKKFYSVDPDKKIFIAYDEEIHEPVGYIQYTIESLAHQRCEVGYVVHPLYQGKGYGKALVDWSIRKATTFEEPIHRLFLYVLVSNRKAVDIYIKYGFRTDGKLLDYAYKDGKYLDAWLMSTLV